MTHNLIFLGNGYYAASGARMSPLYSVGGARWDWTAVAQVLAAGDSVTIRPASDQERASYAEQLAKLLSNCI